MLIVQVREGWRRLQAIRDQIGVLFPEARSLEDHDPTAPEIGLPLVGGCEISEMLGRGGSLAEKLAGTPRPAREAAELMVTLARGMQAAHQAGIVHRDLKLSNVLRHSACQEGHQARLIRDSGRFSQDDISKSVIHLPSLLFSAHGCSHQSRS